MEYFDVFYQPGENPVFCYRSGLTVYEEQLLNGALVSGGWNTAGYPLNVLSNCPSRVDPKDFAEPFAFNLEVNGQCVAYDLNFIDFSVEKSAKNLHAVLILESNLLPLRMKVHTLLDGTAMFTRWLEVENLSEQPLNISRMVLLGGGLESRSESSYSIGYFERDEWGKEGQFTWKPLQPDLTVIDRAFYRQRYRHPLIFLRNEQTGTLWFAQIGWSGGCRFALDYHQVRDCRKGAKDLLSFSAELNGYAPLLVLRPGECFALPEVHMGAVQGDLDLAVHEMHHHIRRSVLSLPADCLVGAGMGAEHDMSVETSKAFIDQFAAMGAEVFIIDAGWECPPGKEMQWGPYNGRNVPDSERYPNGLGELSDYCHQKGLKFGLWVEMERLGKEAPAWREHPEWRSRNVLGEQDAGYLDLAIPEAAAWAEEELARIIAAYQLDLLRVDYNCGSSSYFAMEDTGAGVRECISVRQFNAVYNLYRNLKKRFPHVIFENCAGGGGRTDLGMMKHFDHTWVSDWQKMPRSVSITNGMTMALPPERVDRLFAGMGCHEAGRLDAHLRNTMLGHVSLNVIAPAAAEPNPVQMAFIQHSVQVYKDFIRPILPGCNIYHHTPEVTDTAVLEIEKEGKGALTAFALAGQQTLTVRCRGMIPGKKYRVTLDNTGASFAVDGGESLTLSLPASMTSELVLYSQSVDT
ncbi:MAG: alpha-galactosidase [Clostridia bacterium]|nr:alpha-galactosidase [Clostridia bacterium]